MDETTDDDSGDDWDEITEDFESIPCLFCNEIYNNFSMALEHLVASHRFDLKNFIIKHSLDTYSYIKLINFIRHKNVLSDQLNALNIKTWESEEYLRPVIEDDPWLMFGKNINKFNKNNFYKLIIFLLFLYINFTIYIIYKFYYI